MFDEDAILSCFRCFLGFLLSDLFSVEDTDAQSIFIREAYIKYTCIRGFFARGTYIGVIFDKSVCCVRNVTIKTAGIGDIMYNSVHKPSKSSIKYSRLPTKSIS